MICYSTILQLKKSFRNLVQMLYCGSKPELRNENLGRVASFLGCPLCFFRCVFFRCVFFRFAFLAVLLSFHVPSKTHQSHACRHRNPVHPSYNDGIDRRRDFFAMESRRDVD